MKSARPSDESRFWKCLTRLASVATIIFSVATLLLGITHGPTIIQNIRTVDTLSSDYSKITGRVDTLASNYSKIAGRIDTLNSQYTAISENYGSLNSQYTAISESFGSLNSQYTEISESFGSLNSDYTAISENIGSLNSQYTEISENIGSLNSQYTEISESFGSLNSDYTAISENIGSLNSQYTEISESFGSLNSDYTAISENIGSLNSQYTEISENIGSLNSQYTEISESFGSLNSDYTAISENIGSLNSQYTEIFGQVGIVTDNLSVVADRIDVLSVNRDRESGSSLTIDVLSPSVPPTDTTELPTISVIGGDYGPTDPQLIDSGVPCGKESLDCRYLEFSLTGFEPGRYDFSCQFDGWDADTFSRSRRFGDVFSVTVYESGALTAQRADCYINFARLGGPNGVQIVARGPILSKEDGSQVYGGIVQSNWTKQVKPLAPRSTT